MPSFFKWDAPSRFDLAKEKELEEAAAWEKARKAVDARDKRICRACGKRSELDAVGLTKRGHRHHLVYRSAGGKDISSNLVTLCSKCHNEEHMHRLRIDGDADVKLEFWRLAVDDEWYLDRREVAPGIVEKD
jgi:5-methylcytosine-specific restriction endonuclease McrA